MSRVSTYLNFPGTTEEAFHFYSQIFGTPILGPIHRFSEVPQEPGQAPIPAELGNKVMHIELQILGGHVIMGTDAIESMGQKIQFGNNMHLNLEPDTRAETDRLFQGLSAGGTVAMPLTDMFWGDDFGALTDRFGIQWMFNCASKT